MIKNLNLFVRFIKQKNRVLKMEAYEKYEEECKMIRKYNKRLLGEFKDGLNIVAAFICTIIKRSRIQD